MIDLDAKLIAIVPQSLRCGEQIRAGVRKRKEAQQVLRNRVDLFRRQQVIWIGRIREDVEKLVLRVVAESAREALRAQFGEVAGALLHGRNRRERRFSLAIAKAFIEAKNKCLILLDRRTDRGAKLVLLQRLLRLGEI